MVSQGEKYTQILRTEVKKNEQKSIEAMGELKKEMQHWVQETIHKELSAVWKSIGDLERDCSQILLLQKKATDLAEQQDRLMLNRKCPPNWKRNRPSVSIRIAQQMIKDLPLPILQHHGVNPK